MQKQIKLSPNINFHIDSSLFDFILPDIKFITEEEKHQEAAPIILKKQKPSKKSDSKSLF